MDDAGLLHLASHMPQLLCVDVSSCSGVTPDGVSRAREAAAGCASHCTVIFQQQPVHHYDSE